MCTSTSEDILMTEKPKGKVKWSHANDVSLVWVSCFLHHSYYVYVTESKKSSIPRRCMNICMSVALMTSRNSFQCHACLDLIVQKASSDIEENRRVSLIEINVTCIVVFVRVCHALIPSMFLVFVFSMLSLFFGALFCTLFSRWNIAYSLWLLPETSVSSETLLFLTQQKTCHFSSFQTCLLIQVINFVQIKWVIIFILNFHNWIWNLYFVTCLSLSLFSWLSLSKSHHVHHPSLHCNHDDLHIKNSSIFLFFSFIIHLSHA